MKTDAQTLKRITVALPADLVDFIMDEAQRANVGPADVMQQAVNSFRYLRTRGKSGAKILIDEDGKGLQKFDLAAA